MNRQFMNTFRNWQYLLKVEDEHAKPKPLAEWKRKSIVIFNAIAAWWASIFFSALVVRSFPLESSFPCLTYWIPNIPTGLWFVPIKVTLWLVYWILCGSIVIVLMFGLFFGWSVVILALYIDKVDNDD